MADTKYGTVDNYLACHDRGLRAHIPDIKRSQDNTGRREGIFPTEAFRYDPQADSYRCPAGQELKARRHHVKQQAVDYLCARGICDACELKKPVHDGKDRSLAQASSSSKRTGQDEGSSPIRSVLDRISGPGSISWSDPSPDRRGTASSGPAGGGSGGFRSRST